MIDDNSNQKYRLLEIGMSVDVSGSEFYYVRYYQEDEDGELEKKCEGFYELSKALRFGVQQAQKSVDICKDFIVKKEYLEQ